MLLSNPIMAEFNKCIFFTSGHEELTVYISISSSHHHSIPIKFHSEINAIFTDNFKLTAHLINT